MEATFTIDPPPDRFISGIIAPNRTMRITSATLPVKRTSATAPNAQDAQSQGRVRRAFEPRTRRHLGAVCSTTGPSGRPLNVPTIWYRTRTSGVAMTTPHELVFLLD